VPSYRWAGAHPYRDHRNGRTIEPGGLIRQRAERIAAAHPQDVERIADDTPGPDDWTAVATGTPPFAPGEHTVSELRDRVQEVDDADALRALRTAEADGGDRTTALDAIDARIDELED
jgi:hypothetical protein